MISIFSRLGLLVAICLSALPAGAGELTVLARPGPWPVADRLIAYQGRIWFSTAVKGANHNSADIWSFDPGRDGLRFERYLFSQDAGIPVVHDGLLYWPHEDMREGLGTGVISVTNGRDWRNLQLPPDNTMMHTHAISEWRGNLVAALAGWDSALVTSGDAGRSWNVLVNDPPRVGSFHRYNDVISLGDRLFVRHWERSGLTLAEYRDGRMVDVEGWPKADTISGFTLFGDALYALVHEGEASELWRIGTGAPQRVVTGRGNLDMRALASDGAALWLVTRTEDGGQLWSSDDGVGFSAGDTFSGGVPHDAVANGAGNIHVGGEGADGRAILWGPAAAPEPAAVSAVRALPDQGAGATGDFDAEVQKKRLAAALKTIENYQRHGRPLGAIIRDIVARNPPPGFFTSLLGSDVPDRDIEMFGGRFSVPAREIATWQLIGAMGLNDEKTVPPGLLNEPWRRQPNGPQKWMDPLLIAMHVVKLVGQNDRVTVNALIDRLDRPGDPDWLQSQVAGTLVALTGERFAYDTAAWRTWWRTAKKDWPTEPGSG